MSGSKSPHKPPLDDSTWRSLDVPSSGLRRIKSQVFLLPAPAMILQPRPVKGGTPELHGVAPVHFSMNGLFAGGCVLRGPEKGSWGRGGGLQSCTTQECLSPGVQQRIEYNINFSFLFSFFFFFWFSFRAVPTAYKSGKGIRGRYSCKPMPQPQPHQIQATSVAYSTAHGNTGSLTH